MPGADPRKLRTLAAAAFADMAASATTILVYLGDRLGLFRALADYGPTRPPQLAALTGTHERYVREWLCAMAAAGYVDYDPDLEAFALSPEQAAVFADDGHPASIQGLVDVLVGCSRDEPKLERAFLSGAGIPWAERHPIVFGGAERLFRPGYEAELVETWLPALDGVLDKLRRGAQVADIACGHGASTLIMARAFPRSTFHAFDSHPPSVEEACRRARDRGLAENALFRVAPAQDFPGLGYDLVTTLDSLHVMGDPVAVARHVRRSLRPDGTWLVVEPFAGDDLEDNFTAHGRAMYALSTMICVPTSLSQEVGAAVSAQAGEAALRRLILEAGFRSVDRVVDSDRCLVLEARL
ncbi:MAG: methyltransferase domain-containing protein [Hyphomicrobiales bacterium]|nr:methyltransferase domain-containing protein [Hyphomicrobiales bacterium]